MGEKSVAVLGILLLLAGFCCLPRSTAARGGTPGHLSWNVLDKPRLSSDAAVVLGHAAVAQVSVVLIDGDGEDPADVFGVITARVGDAPDDILLFQKSSAGYVSVRPGNLIPLSRSVLTGVPLDSHITIGADLWDYDTLSPDDEIAKGNAHFPAKTSGDSHGNIKGTYGEIQVKVTWHGSSVVDDSKSESTCEE